MTHPLTPSLRGREDFFTAQGVQRLERLGAPGFGPRENCAPGTSGHQKCRISDV